MDRLTIVLPRFSGGGAERVVRLLAREFAERGHSCTMLGLYETANDRRERDVHYVGLGAAGPAAAVRRLVTRFRTHPPRRILSTLKNASLAAEIARRAAAPRARHVIRIANSYEQEFARLTPLRQLAWRQAIAAMHRGADATIAVSNGLLEETCAWLPAISRRAVVIPNPLEDRPRSTQPARIEAGEESKVLMVGRLAPQKDHATALAAITRLKVPVRLLIVGEGQLRDDLARRAEALGIAEQARFLGWRDDIPALMEGCDLLLHTSRFEGCPNVLIEAMGAGLPIVATDCPHGPGEIVTDRVIGDLVPVGDAEAIAVALERRLATPDGPQHRERRRNVARARYALDDVADNYLRVLFP